MYINFTFNCFELIRLRSHRLALGTTCPAPTTIRHSLISVRVLFLNYTEHKHPKKVPAWRLLEPISRWGWCREHASTLTVHYVKWRLNVGRGDISITAISQEGALVFLRGHPVGWVFAEPLGDK